MVTSALKLSDFLCGSARTCAFQKISPTMAKARFLKSCPARVRRHALIKELSREAGLGDGRDKRGCRPGHRLWSLPLCSSAGSRPDCPAKSGPLEQPSRHSPFVPSSRNIAIHIMTFGTSMTPARIGWELAAVAVLCVLTIFLFPAAQGPYSVVHGPATALQAARAALRVRIAIVQAALNSLVSSLRSPLVVLSWLWLSNTEFRSAHVPESRAILRC